MNQKESALLQGLDEFHYKLYFHAIRRYMDFSTGIVGIKRRISYQSILEAMYIEPRSGLGKHSYPTISKIRRAIKILKKVGLLIEIQKSCLIFECPYATRGYQVQNQVGSRPTQKNGYADTEDDIETNQEFQLKSESYNLYTQKADAQADKRKNNTPPQADIPPLSDINNNILFNINVGSTVDKPPSRFEEFWKEYPRKENKKKAYDIWIRKGLDEISHQLINDVIQRKSKHSSWLRGFVPHATTYLNGERWQDEITTERTYEATRRDIKSPSNVAIFDAVIAGAFKPHKPA